VSFGDPVSQAQVNFLTCLIGLSIAVADTGGRMKLAHLDALRVFFRSTLRYAPEDQEVVQRLIEEMYASRDRLDVAGMCAYYRSVSSPEGRLLLLRLLFQIALADGEGVSAPEEETIRRVAALLGMEEGAFRRIRAEFIREASRAFDILGVSPDATPEEITRAYRRLVMENHPDRVASLGPEFVTIAEEKFKAIQEAYEEARREKGF
jgi:DnaJ like chaperone protein